MAPAADPGCIYHILTSSTEKSGLVGLADMLRSDLDALKLLHPCLNHLVCNAATATARAAGMWAFQAFRWSLPSMAVGSQQAWLTRCVVGPQLLHLQHPSLNHSRWKWVPLEPQVGGTGGHLGGLC